ncbi:hypothetical protein JQ620_34915 [Bradyrhizobium sp. AUGA SZCCT0274]|uniref:hypothetical protein n=1 Tax=Bradyrhizobium sp. AUGA SZCCT0274 TaxID=2807670 RepID=UPI001BA8E028|nr:hypothetical protein [Bradyrhizobium sp. AUGA SZCCT0274]MBR1245280.1 hypothetical protein [Bradyrhizobium sp. AUGA SZCCT0274]
MPDLVKSLIFILCQLSLLALVVSPLLLERPGQAPRSRQMRSLCYGLPAAILIISAAVNIFKATFPGDQAKLATLGVQVHAGKEVLIRFDPETCALYDLGSIACGSDYHGRYDRGRGRWTVSGLDRSTGSIITGSATNAGSSLGSLSLWGMLSRFEDDGTIVYLGQGVGRLRLAPKAPDLKS